MDTIKMSEEINRRRFLCIAAVSIAAAKYGVVSSASASAPSLRPSCHRSQRLHDLKLIT